ncbi:MAG: hypothetical protein WC539_04405 [Nitrospirota bacterium]
MNKLLVILVGLLLVGINAFAANGDLTVGGVLSAQTISAPNVMTKYFESAELSLPSSSAVSTPHNLGSMPKLWKATIRCKTAELGYSIGDEVDVTNGGFYNWYGYYTAADAINITWIVNGTMSIINKTGTSFATGSVTPANWKLVLRAWK